MDIVLPYKNIETLEEENLKDDNGLTGPDNKKLKWNDPGLLDLLNSLIFISYNLMRMILS